MFFPEDEDAAVDLDEHFLFCGAHVLEDGFAAEECRDDDGGSFFGDPEAWRGGVDESLPYLAEADVGCLRDEAAIGVEECGVAVTCECECASEGLHGMWGFMMLVEGKVSRREPKDKDSKAAGRITLRV